MLNLALLCTTQSPSLRPSMSSVVSMLEGKVPVREPIVERSLMGQSARIKAFQKLALESQTDYSLYSHDSQPWNDSSVSNPSNYDHHDNSTTTQLLKE